MILKLPIFEKGKLKYVMTSERDCCGDDCLYRRKELKAFHIPGLGGDGNHLSYPLVTSENTFIKNRNISTIRNKKLTYNYTTPSKSQYELLNFLRYNELPGLVKIVDMCDCSYEMEFVDGKISYKHSIPITKHYELFNFVDEWNYDSLIDFVKQSCAIIDNLHNKNMIHGDLTAHNFIIDSNGSVKLIDLDNVTFGNEELYLQDITCYCLYTILPILTAFEVEERIGVFLDEVSKEVLLVKYDALWAKKLINIIENIQRYSSKYRNSPFISGYLYNLNMLKDISLDRSNLTNKMHQVQVELMEAIRIKDAAMLKATQSFDEQMNSATEYAQSLEKARERYENEISNLNEAVKEMNNYISVINATYSETEIYAKSLESEKENMYQEFTTAYSNLSELEKSFGKVESENESLHQKLKEAEISLGGRIKDLENIIQSQEMVISEKEKEILALEKKSLFSKVKENIFKR